MIDRYTFPKMRQIWSDETKFRKWLQVEITVCEVLTEMGQIPEEEFLKLKQKASFSIERIREIEAVTRHDLIAFLSAVAETLGPESRFIHFGLTSTDIVDTAQALQVKEASTLIEEAVLSFLSTLKSQAFRYKETPMMGRTHGIHAEPVTFGFKLTVWYAEMERNLERFRRARKNLEVGKISGPVGTFSYLPPQVEERVCEKLKIDHARVSTQTLQRDRHAEYLTTLAILGSSYDKIATEIRHLQRTEVREASEGFSAGQKGSSAMPHKRNPITCENISGLSRILRSNALASLENIPLWHERDISHSSVERVILPDSTTLTHYLTIKLTEVIKNLDVNETQMADNLHATGGLIFSGALLLRLVQKGVLRDNAYEWIQKNAMHAQKKGINFYNLVLQDLDIKRHLTNKEIDEIFDVQKRLQHVDAVFARVYESS